MVSGEKALRGIDVPVLITHDAFDEETGLLERTRDAFHLLPDGSVLDMTAPPVGIAVEYTPIEGVPVSDEAVERVAHASSSASAANPPCPADVASQWATRWVPVGR